MSFNGIKGYKEELAFLETAIEKKAFDSAYLFTGSDITEKRKTALNFAKAINCASDAAIKPCGFCVNCKRIDQGIYPDIFFIRPAGNLKKIGINEIRRAREKVFTKPYEGKYRVIIIEDAQDMTQESQNAILKTLEEMPPANIFLLLALSVSGILPTVISRCRILNFEAEPFNRIPQEKKDFVTDNLLSYLEGRNVNTEWLYADKKDMGANIDIILSFFRDAYISKIDPASAYFLNNSKAALITRRARNIPAPSIERFMDNLVKYGAFFEANVNPKILADAIRLDLEGMVKNGA